jgi:hypothetical protein
LDLTHVLRNPAPTTPFKQSDTDRMQAIKRLAAIFEAMVPKRTTGDELTEPTTTQPTPLVPTPTVPAPRVPTAPAQRSRRGHQPPQVTQEE